jgi:hypothetical protein
VDLTPYVVRIRQFVQDYGLPMIATVLFLILVISGLFIRDLRHISVAGIVESLDSQGVGYGKLLSNDKTGDLTVDTENSINSGSSGSTTPPRGTSNSFSVNTNNPSGGGSSGGGSAVAAPFAATVTSFDQGAVTLQCTKSNPKPQWCSKRYAFSAGIRSQNGPGTVSYSWRSTIASATQDGSVSVGTGVVLTAMSKTITIPCDQPTSFTLQFVILAPGFTQSAVKNINHNCNEL